MASPNAEVGAQPTNMGSLSTKYPAEPHSLCSSSNHFMDTSSNDTDGIERATVKRGNIGAERAHTPKQAVMPR